MAASFRYNTDQLYSEAVEILSKLIEIPSISTQEDKTADLIEGYLKRHGVEVHRKGNNIWCFNKDYDPDKETILLNSHHDTVKPNESYTKFPFEAIQEDGKLYGLGSNDAGGALVCLMMAFLYFHSQKKLAYNLLFLASAEEEISGAGGVRSVIREFEKIYLGIVGEPTEMNMAIHEKGLMVLDCYAAGVSGHAAREEGTNAIYAAIKDIEWFRKYKFPKESTTLGPVKMSVTVIDGGTQHNVVPDRCHYVVDVRTTDAYTNQEVLEIIKKHVGAEVKERSTRLQPSGISKDHPVVVAAKALDIKLFGSTTMSDQALIPFHTVKIGPGKSERSHTADEFIYLEEIREGIMGYLMLLNKIIK